MTGATGGSEAGDPEQAEAATELREFARHHKVPGLLRIAGL